MGVRVLDRLMAWKCYRRAHALVQINNGFYCTKCKRLCCFAVDHENGVVVQCGCTWSFPDNENAMGCWIPVTITIRERKP